MNSILESTKKMLGIDESYDIFDPDIIMHINTVFVILNQLGVGPDQPFVIYSKESTWDDFFSGNTRIEMVKSYMYARVKMLFDPPTGALKEALDKSISEMEFRMNIIVDPKEE